MRGRLQVFFVSLELNDNRSGHDDFDDDAEHCDPLLRIVSVSTHGTHVTGMVNKGPMQI